MVVTSQCVLVACASPSFRDVDKPMGCEVCITPASGNHSLRVDRPPSGAQVVAGPLHLARDTERNCRTVGIPDKRIRVKVVICRKPGYGAKQTDRVEVGARVGYRPGVRRIKGGELPVTVTDVPGLYIGRCVIVTACDLAEIIDKCRSSANKTTSGVSHIS